MKKSPRPAFATLWCAALVLSACAGSDKPPRQQATTSSAASGLLAGRVLDGSDDLAIPNEIALVGPNLVIVNEEADSAIRVIRASDGKLVRVLGRRGGGPGEFQGAWTIDVVPESTSQFWVFDMDLSRMIRVDLDHATAGERKSWRSVNLSGGAVTSPTWVGDTLLVSPGIFGQEGRLAHLNGKGELVRLTGPTPPGKEGVPVPVRHHAYQSSSALNRERSLVALATRHADRIEILRLDGTPVAVGRGPLQFEPVYSVASSGGHPVFASGEDLRFGYVDVAATPDRIFALYSGRSRKEAPGRANFGREVHVFDWSGKLLGSRPLDAELLRIAVDPSGRKLYGVRHEPEPAIMEYDLPEFR